MTLFIRKQRNNETVTSGLQRKSPQRSTWEILGGGPIGGDSIEEAKTEVHTKCLSYPWECLIRGRGQGIKLRKAKLKPTNSSVEEGEVDIWWAVGSKILSFDHIFVQAVTDKSPLQRLKNV